LPHPRQREPPRPPRPAARLPPGSQRQAVTRCCRIAAPTSSAFDHGGRTHYFIDETNKAEFEEKFRNRQIECQNYAYEHGVDQPEAANWKWPY
jgi:hypothetical protein